MTRVMKFGVGQPVRRVEDDRLVRGEGVYTSDIAPEGALHAVFVRSPHACARFRLVDRQAALKIAGVKAVLAASDVSSLGPIPCLAPTRNSNGKLTPLKPYPVMADGEAQHVGDIVAMVVAETALAARDGAEALAIDWESLSPVVDTWPRSSRAPSSSLPARRATSPLTPILATRPRPTRSSRARPARFRSGSSIRGSFPISWSRAARSPRSTPAVAG